MQETDWASYPLASIYAAMDEQTGREVPPAFAHWREMIKAYADDDVAGFNTAAREYRRLLESVTPEELAPPESGTVVSLDKADFEAYFNRAAAFNWASWIYVLAFVLVACSWLGWTRPLNRAAFWVIAVTFVLHTLALAGRIYISGRPPVTNLYSSAVFIGWAGVLFGLGLEAVYRMGIGNVVAAVTGFLTLRIAHGLAMDGDTFHVLEAVLDTQFWLATHVVCVTLGYAATYVAAVLGTVYLLGTNWAERLLGVVLLAAVSAYLFYDGTTSGDFAFITLGAMATLLGGIILATLIMRLNPGPGFESTVTRMNYGVLCFALFFSFVGTVLGGLWADDSWGRFWGWDPKENGALIIVLWNALVLHARWDGMVKSRGLAVLTVLGGIVVSWSWFGVNELGIGLHSYGFTEGRLAKLFWACFAMLAIAGLACVTMLAIACFGWLRQVWWRSASRAV
jgi:ABC-type transport system involved in cytochrome c biogenesis permease subunit